LAVILQCEGMSVLILKNIATEGPGTIESFLRENGISSYVVDLSSEPLPSAEEFDTLLMLGGPMSVNDEAQYPYLTGEMSLAEKFMRSGRKVLGICLGAQLMAKALGARVYAGREKEIGWYNIDLADSGTDDKLMHVLSGGKTSFRVFHWHGETFDIPEGAERLAGSALFPNQAFRFGRNAYAFQFHMEVTREMIYDWLRNEPVDMETVRRDTEACYSDYADRAEQFCNAFFSDNR